MTSNVFTLDATARAPVVIERDTDVDELARRIVKVQAEIADLGAEAIRVRDQHRQQIDAMKAGANGTIDTALALEAMRQQRDEARAQRDAARAQRDAESVAWATTRVALEATETKLAFAQSEVAKLNAFTDIGAAVETQRALAATRAALAPPELVTWAHDAVRRFPVVEHSAGTYEVLPGVTIRSLREWLVRVVNVPRPSPSTPAATYVTPMQEEPCMRSDCSGTISAAHGKCTMCNENYLDGDRLPNTPLYRTLRALSSNGR